MLGIPLITNKFRVLVCGLLIGLAGCSTPHQPIYMEDTEDRFSQFFIKINRREIEPGSVVYQQAGEVMNFAGSFAIDPEFYRQNSFAPRFAVRFIASIDGREGHWTPPEFEFNNDENVYTFAGTVKIEPVENRPKAKYFLRIVESKMKTQVNEVEVIISR